MNKQTGRNIVKTVLGGGTGVCGGFVATKVIAELLPPQVKIPLKIATYVGGAGIGLAIGDAAEQAIDNRIDDICDVVDLLQSKKTQKTKLVKAEKVEEP